MQLTTKNIGIPKKGQVLTNKSKAKFKMSLERSLENGFCFKDLQKREVKAFNSFIDKTVGKNLTVLEVNQRFGRSPDKSDSIDGYNIYHYEVSGKFRIHGYLKEGYFVICRIDPNHRVH
ncbi:MAG6450 family protein [Lentibacillus saliphilus]|uniref:MAG6450 family protein n=1 Tax=Lentibacillus saliphilus TaxID=2737028 RepID=UPI001C300A70|nr:hypothetical protein [Lentibacillus saliphilus]